MYSRNLLSVLLALLLLACQPKSNEVKETNKETSDSIMKKMESHLVYKDHHSYARPDEAVVKHLSWKAKVDFENKIIKATATYTIENRKSVDTIFLDSRNLKILEVRRDDREGALGYKSHKTNGILGSELAIPISSNTNTISIDYETTKGADALQFLEPVQTAGKEYPFLFTQSQAILARTWLPCQDSPGIRFTYDAEVSVPADMMAVMSAGNPTEKNSDGVYRFKMDQAVPSYLMALAVGNIEYRSLGKETGVYAEPNMIEAAAYEFADMQNMLDTAESLYGDYRWGKYDVIVLPPSFPFGGMENPRLTFATPTIIAGDRSLTALIAHELAHSWSGNLVTNANWEDIWLNEGFTVYFEQRIMEEIYGADFANMLALLSYEGLLQEIEELNEAERAPDTRLRVDLKDRNPDDGLTGIPYDKGYFFLRLIEETVGRENWDAFLKEYFDRFAFQVMTTDAFVFYLNENLLSKNPEWSKSIMPEQWIFKEGLPDNCPQIQSTKFEKVDQQISALQGGLSAKELQTEEWKTPQWLYFINQLNDTLTMVQMKDLDDAFGFTNSGNAEIQAAWFIKVIPNNYVEADEASKNFLIEVGRRKFLTPIYKAILKSKAGKERAMDIYKLARPNYHAVSTETIDDLLEM